ncbi:MAG: putative porin [bacterium]
MNRVRTAVAGALVLAGIGGTGLAQTTVPQSSTPPVVPKTWVDSITLKGDLRYRYEIRNDDSALDANKQTYKRQLDRIRARVQAEAKCNDNLKAVIGLSTDEGSPAGDPISGNQTLTGAGSKKSVYLDLAYLDYNFFGDNPNELHAIAGKMKNPFITFQDDLVWDPDVTPEGLALKGQMGMGFATLYANGGYIWIQERSGNINDDSTMLGGQLAAKFEFMPELALTVGASYNNYRNIQGLDLVDYNAAAKSYGNSTKSGTVSGTTTNKAWASEFTPLVLFAQVDAFAMGTPVAVFAQSLNNNKADKANKGVLYGIAVGKAKNPQTWEIGYSHSKVEKDSTLGMWTDSDRWGGGTDGQGHKIYAKYQILKNLQAGVTYFKDDKVISDSAKTKDYDRLQVDLVATF